MLLTFSIYLVEMKDPPKKIKINKSAFQDISEQIHKYFDILLEGRKN